MKKQWKRLPNGEWKYVSPRMTIDNKSSIPTDVIKAAVNFVKPSGIKGFKVTVRDSKTWWMFRGHGNGLGITARINPKFKYPYRLHTYQRGQLKGRRYYLSSLTEALIYLLAHELMHTKQGQRHGKRRYKKVWGARGKYSEIETESYAIRKLREYRRLSSQVDTKRPLLLTQAPQ
jgi:hypothetical protein